LFPKGIYSLSPHEVVPFLLKGTWLWVSFFKKSFYPWDIYLGASSLKKLFKNVFFSSISFMERQNNLRKIWTL
jgi:hypothetical protein